VRVFAIELSSRRGSIALVDDGRVVSEAVWEENFKNRQQLFDALRAMEIDWETVDLFAVGRGPGAFSGMRIAFSVANALAAPGGRPVHALNSGSVLAADIPAETVAVVGDARRGQLWAGLFTAGAMAREFRLLDPDELPSFIPSGACVASPEEERLKEVLSGFDTLGKPVYPAAATLGRMVVDRVARGEASESCEPLYMHPPVFIAPRFPA